MRLAGAGKRPGVAADDLGRRSRHQHYDFVASLARQGFNLLARRARRIMTPGSVGMTTQYAAKEWNIFMNH